MNDKGVFIGLAGGFASRDSDAGYGIPALCVNQHLLQYANSASDAVNMFSTWAYQSSNNVLLADTGGHGYVVEVTNAFRAVRKSGDFGEGDFIYQRNNYLTAQGGVANLAGSPGAFMAHGGWAADFPPGLTNIDSNNDVQHESQQVNVTTYDMLHQYQGKWNLAAAEMLYRFAGKMPHPSTSLDQSLQGFRATNAAAWETPLNLEDRSVVIAQPDNGDNGVIHVCTGPAAQVATPYEPGPDDDYYLVAPTHTFYDIALTDSPADVVSASRDAAHDANRNAYQKLMYLNAGESAHQPLFDLFSLAQTEWYQGENWLYMAGQASGNTQLLDYAKALTSFTEDQCHAQQVYDEIVPPATTPSQLGLAPYKAVSYPEVPSVPSP